MLIIYLMSDVTVINKIPQFIQEHAKAMDRALNRAAIDIERLSKQRVPFLKGQLKAGGHHKRVGFLNYITYFNKVYAAYQEFGGDKKRTVRRYSYEGKQKLYLTSAGRDTGEKFGSYLGQEIGKIKL